MARLKRKHPNKDFFIMDIADVVPKDDTASMEHPLFSLATKPDMRQLRYENAGVMLKVVPSGDGLATIHDKDILIWAISKIVHAKNQGKPYLKVVEGSGYELLVATNRGTSVRDYDRLEAAFIRLSGTRFVSSIRTGGQIEKRIFGMVDEASFNYDVDGTMRRDKVTITLSDWPSWPETAYLGFSWNKRRTKTAYERCRYIATLSAGNLKPRPSATRSALMGYFGLLGLMATIRKSSSFDRKVRP